MPRKKSIEIQPTSQEKMLLGQRVKRGLLREAVRADIVLRAARGQTNYMITKQLGISRNTVKKWRYRFAREGLAGLKTRPIPGRPRKAAKLLQAAKEDSQLVVTQGLGLPSNQAEAAKS